MDKKIPIVSVLMTCYNRAKYIAEAIESVQNSTLKDWELIITDDHSVDNSLEIALEYKNRDNRIKVFKNEENLGDYPNRNKCASYAMGKYLKYLDADDIIYSHGLEAMVNAMEKFSSAAIGLSQSKVDDKKPYPILLSPEESYREHFLGRGVLNCGPSGTIIKKEIFDKIGGFKVPRYLGDADLWYEIAQKYSILKLQPSLVWWRQHEEQEYQIGGNSFYLFETYPLSLKYLQNVDCPLNKADQKKATKKLKHHEARKILALLKKTGNIKLFYKLVKRFNFGLSDIIIGFKRYRHYL